MKTLSKRAIVILLIAAIVSVLGVIAGVLETDGRDHTPDKAEVLLPDILMPKNESYITQKTDSLVTIEGFIKAPEDAQSTDALDDPDFEYPDEKASYIYKSHGYKFDEEGNLYILIDLKETTKKPKSTAFSVTIQDEAIAECPGIYVECNGYTHTAWQKQ